MPRKTLLCLLVLVIGVPIIGCGGTGSPPPPTHPVSLGGDDMGGRESEPKRYVRARDVNLVRRCTPKFCVKYPEAPDNSSGGQYPRFLVWERRNGSIVFCVRHPCGQAFSIYAVDVQVDDGTPLASWAIDCLGNMNTKRMIFASRSAIRATCEEPGGGASENRVFRYGGHIYIVRVTDQLRTPSFQERFFDSFKLKRLPAGATP